MRRIAAAAFVLAISPAYPVDPGASAVEVARVLVPREAWERVIQNLANDALVRLQSHPGGNLHYPADFPAKVKAEMEGALPYDVVISMNAKELSAAFTEAELKDLLAFWQTPVGKKYLKEESVVASKVAAEAEKRVNQKMPEIMKRLAKLAQSDGSAGKAGAK